MKRHGFTLIELLIASTILSIVLLLATGAFASAASYNGKLREMRRASQDARKVATFISDDIRMANGSTQVPRRYRFGDVDVGEIAFLGCNNTKCWRLQSFTNNSHVYELGNPNAAQALLILKEDEGQAVMYRTTYDGTGDDADAGVQRLTRELSSPLSLEFADWDRGDISSDSMDTRVEFSGFAPLKEDRHAQPFVKLNIQSKTEGNFDDINSGQKAEFTLQTLVETRDYNP